MKAISIAVVFISISLLLYMSISMMAQIPEPAVDSDEYEQFEGLSKIIDIGYSGFWVVLMIIVVLAILAAFKLGGKI